MFKTTWKLYFKNNEKIPGNLLKNLEKSWKYHGILSVRKSGNPEPMSLSNELRLAHQKQARVTIAYSYEFNEICCSQIWPS